MAESTRSEAAKAGIISQLSRFVTCNEYYHLTTSAQARQGAERVHASLTALYEYIQVKKAKVKAKKSSSQFAVIGDILPSPLHVSYQKSMEASATLTIQPVDPVACQLLNDSRTTASAKLSSYTSDQPQLSTHDSFFFPLFLSI